jgi:Tle cognate immunity protein 4 C-terminal domain
MSSAKSNVLSSIASGLLALGAVFSAGCVAREAPEQWNADCAGRMEIQIPGSGDIAAYSAKNLLSQLEPAQPGIPQAEFEDGEVAGQSAWSRYDGSIFVSHALATGQLDALRAAALRVRGEAQKRAKDRPSAQGVARGGHPTQPASLTKENGVTWGSRAYGAFIEFGSHALLWRSAGDLQSSAAAFMAMDVGLTERAPFSVPRSAGVCLPYAFIADSGATDRDVRMTYRLGDFPDVQVLLKDATAASTEPGIRTKNAEPKAVTVSFWSQQLTQAKEVRPLWEPSTRAVTLAGFGGLASFVQLTREDGSIDYGYLAVVRGDPRAKEDTPDLMLFIIRDSKAAKAKGKMPLGKDEFIKMAETIAGSVKRRPVQ